jgi:hypothetical protein
MVGLRADRIKVLLLFAPLVALLCGSPVAAGAKGVALRTVTYHGYSVTVPRSWPVFSLAKAPHTCVRFNRHALYLGSPSATEDCPAPGIGRTEAILVEPLSASAARVGGARDAALAPGGSATTFNVPGAGVRVTATWLTDPRLVSRALHRRTLPKPHAARLQPHLAPRASGGGAPAPASADVYTGPGFDTCHTPSSEQMSAWTFHSPYHAIGIYIGGANAACPPGPSNPNLTSAWLSSQADAGWHFIPIYVGLQAQGACGCSSITPSQATTQGTAAADDAVVQAQSLNLGSGTPIYYDMESYSRTQSNSSAVLAFLAAWTTEIHAKGYLAGVYGSLGSTIADLVTQYGTSYPEPDDIWFAAWPGAGTQTTSDPNIPSADWPSHQRLHQYSGGHNETYGGVTLDIDGDYLDGATAGALSSFPPTLSVSASAGGLTNLTASWGGLGLARWEVLAGTNPAAMTGIKSASLKGAQTTITVRSAAPYFAVDALGSAGQLLATSAAVASPVRLALVGHSSFVGERSEVGAVPVGCYLTTSCQIVATIYSGRTRIARSTPQRFRPGGSGLIYYRLNWAGLRLLAKVHNAKIPVQITITDATGTSANARMSLIPYPTSGRSPARSLTPSLAVGAVGTTDFIHGSSGGVLVRCSTPGACWITAKLTSGRATIASVHPQLVGGLELGYVFFSLTARGRQLLRQTTGNQLGATLTLRSGTSVATARLALVAF